MDYSPLFVSIKTASLAMVITFFLGISAAWGVVRMRHERIKTALDGIFALPLVLPPTVAGFFLLYIFGVNRPVGGLLLDWFGIRIPFSWGATVLASVVISFPLMYRSARGAFEQVDENLIFAGETLGFSEWEIFWRVSIPSAMPGIAAGGIMAFARGLGEFGATAMIAGNIAGRTRTLPLAIYSAAAAGDMKLSFSYVQIIIVILLLVVTGINSLITRSGKRRRGGGTGL